MAACLRPQPRLVDTLCDARADAASATDAGGATCLHYLFAGEENESAREREARLFLAARLLRLRGRVLLQQTVAPDGGPVAPWLRTEAQRSPRRCAEAAADLVAAVRSAEVASTTATQAAAATARARSRTAHGQEQVPKRPRRCGEEDDPADVEAAAWAEKLADAWAADADDLGADGFDAAAEAEAAYAQRSKGAAPAEVDDDAYAAELRREMYRRKAARGEAMGPAPPPRGRGRARGRDAEAEAERVRRAEEARLRSAALLAEQARLDAIRGQARLAAAAEAYEERTARFFAELPTHAAGELRHADVPFPGVTDAAVSDAVLAAAAAAGESYAQRRRRLLQAQKRWHPDVWQRHAGALHVGDRDAVLAEVHVTSQRLNRLVEAESAAADSTDAATDTTDRRR